VLPPEQTDLIDILTAEMDVLMDDIVAGKSGGTTVLCAGPPGVGKTLTAEVYAEIIGRPLYRVHSGQLGLNVATMETALKEALTRAQRWGAVMLIDEADVYIKRRDDNLAMNAVVGVFLRVLEYFNGLLFLTTNRIDDIDEAIVSRCIALIRYQAPDEAARARIWRVMAGQFGLALDAAQIDWLARHYAQASGRDIKGLAKLVTTYCHHKQVAPSREVFERCAVFRGFEPGPEPRRSQAFEQLPPPQAAGAAAAARGGNLRRGRAAIGQADHADDLARGRLDQRGCAAQRGVGQQHAGIGGAADRGAGLVVQVVQVAGPPVAQALVVVGTLETTTSVPLTRDGSVVMRSAVSGRSVNQPFMVLRSTVRVLLATVRTPLLSTRVCWTKQFVRPVALQVLARGLAYSAVLEELPVSGSLKA
jgi:hypothetical protein